MPAPGQAVPLEDRIDEWRSHLRRRQAIHAVDVTELEDHLRETVAALVDAGLATDEAFLIAVKRIGSLDALSREFALEHSDRLWKQLVAVSDTGDARARARTEVIVACCLAALAATVIMIGIRLDRGPDFFRRNLSFSVLPFLAGYFAWKRRVGGGTLRVLGVAFSAAVTFANVYPFVPDGSTDVLTALHLPVALWLVVGIAYAGNRWHTAAGRMDFVRFSGELLIYLVLIALGGASLTTFMLAIFRLIGITAQPFFESWLLPCGAAGAFVIAARLVEAKQSVIENMAPVLTRLFTPLFAGVLVTFLVTLLVTGRGFGAERNVLIVFDTLLVLVLALLLYSVSARDAQSSPSAFDVVQVVLVLSALVANAVALWTITERITGLGLTPNRVAVLAMNVILLVNLTWSAVLYLRFLRGRGSFTALERWQTDYLPVYGVWAAIVVIVFPPMFGYA